MTTTYVVYIRLSDRGWIGGSNAPEVGRTMMVMIMMIAFITLNN
jgi:hypothetical protein